MRYSTKTQLLRGSAIVAAGLLFASPALAQEITIAFEAGELGATSYNPATSNNVNSA